MSPGCPSMWTCNSPHVAPAPPCMFYPLFPTILLCSLTNRSPNTFTQATATTPSLHHTCTSRHWGPLMNKKVTISPTCTFSVHAADTDAFFSDCKRLPSVLLPVILRFNTFVVKLVKGPKTLLRLSLMIHLPRCIQFVYFTIFWPCLKSNCIFCLKKIQYKNVI